MPNKKKPAPAKKPAAKVHADKTVSQKKPLAKPAPVPLKKEKSPSNDKAAASRDALRTRILGAKKPAKPIAFSLDEVRAIAKTVVIKDAKAADAKAAAAKPALAKKGD